MIEGAPLRQRTPTRLVAATASLLLVELAHAKPPASTAPVPAAITARSVCDAISGKKVGDVVLATSIVAEKGGLPTHCKVTGRIAPLLNFEMRLPNAWNGKLYYGGGGGMTA